MINSEVSIKNMFIRDPSGGVLLNNSYGIGHNETINLVITRL